MIASIDGYSIGKFIHVAAVIVVFGATYAYPFFFAVAEKAGLQHTIVAMRTTQIMEKYLITPGAVVVLLAGAYMLSQVDYYDFGTSWVIVGLIVWVIVVGMGHAFFTPKGKRAIELAERDLAAGGQPSSELETVVRQLATGGQIAGLLVLVATFFMVVKP
jgi:uncharacterized membrane protein